MLFNFNARADKSTINNKLIFIISVASLISGWLILWVAQWQLWLQPYIWLRLGIALVVFITPGIFIFLLLNNAQTNRINAITFGFVISHFLLALLGTLGRFIHFPFAIAHHGMMLLGLIFMLLFCIPTLSKSNWRVDYLLQFRKIFSFWPIALIIVIAIQMSLQRAISYDDYAYLAYLTNWQHAISLDFNDVFFGINEFTIKRFFLVSTPFSQAFLAKTSGLHGLFVVGGFYEPFLVVLACSSVYNLARTLGLSKQSSMASVGLQITFLALLSEYLHPGFPFFNQLSTDKATAAFILVPVFIQSTFSYIEAPNKRNLVLCFLTSTSLSFMHPVIYAFAAAITGLIILFHMINSIRKEHFFFLGLIAFSIFPQVIIRFGDFGSQPSYSFRTETFVSFSGLVSVWKNTIFYGFNPTNLGMAIPFKEFIPFPDKILQFAWLIIPILSAAIALQYIKQNSLAKYVLASFTFVSIAGIPFTGWVIGYFLSAIMLERTTWVFPYGIGTVFFLRALKVKFNSAYPFRKWVQQIQKNEKFRRFNLITILLPVLPAGMLFLFIQYNHLPTFERVQVNTVRYGELAQIGNYLDENITDQALVVGTDEINDLIPGLSSKAKVISFWFWDPFYSYYYTQNDRIDRHSDQQDILSNTISPEKRLQLIKKYHVKYLLLQSGKRNLVKPLVSTYPSNFNIEQIGRYLLVKTDY